jgi:hypothetical protein
MAQTKTSYFPLGGGLDISTPALSVRPGRALALSNYSPWFNGGYRRIDGFERFDGRPKPSEQSFVGFDVDDASSLTVGDTVTGDTSGASSTVIGIWIDDGTYGSDAIGLASGDKLTSGPFENGETCNTAAFTITRTPTLKYAPDQDLEDAWLLAAQNLYRDDINEVPGSGITRGAWQRGSNVFAIRDNVGATAGVLHVASATGWTTTGITMGHYLFFDGGGGGSARALPVEGDTITGITSSATATVHRVIELGGSTAGNDTFGYLVLTDVTGGPFTTGENLQEGGTTWAQADGGSVQFAFSVGGHYRFVNFNFFGGSGTFRTYGCNGVDPAFEIDENLVVSPILFPKTAVADQPDYNVPFLIEEHRNYLFLAFPGGRFAHSVIGEPMTFNGFLGAAEFGVGDEITGLNSVAGGVLAITTERETRGLFGVDVSDWELKMLAERTGGRLYSTQKLDTVYAFDDLGITSLARTDQFGDFIGSTVSQLVQPLINELRDKVTTSSLVRKSNQYRVYFSDGSGLIMYVPSTGMTQDQRVMNSLQVHFGSLRYPFAVRKIYNSEDENGDERTYFCSDDGYIYEDQVGYNFDGEEIASVCRLVFNQVGTPSIRKRFRRAILELESQKPLTIKVVADLTYGSDDSGTSYRDVVIAAGGGFWDSDNWDEFFFDGQVVSTASAGLTGTGSNIGLLLYNSSAIARPFILQGITLHYDERRLQR